MITPEIRGGHEVTMPVAVAAPKWRRHHPHQDITVTSLATASGNDQMMSGRFLGDPLRGRQMPGVQRTLPEDGAWQRASARRRCAALNGAGTSPLPLPNGYTICLRPQPQRRVTLDQGRGQARSPAMQRTMLRCPTIRSRAILTFAPHDSRGRLLRPFMGQRHHAVDSLPGFTQRRRLPAPSSSGAVECGLTAPTICPPHRRPPDIGERASAILICPVRVAGGGVYLGDMHLLQRRRLDRRKPPTSPVR